MGIFTASLLCIRLTNLISFYFKAGNQNLRDSNIFSSTSAQSGGANETFTKLLRETENDDHLPTDQTQKLKIAFAEGYLAAGNTDGNQKSGRAMKYLKVIDQSVNNFYF